jgi:nucleoporin NUP159
MQDERLVVALEGGKGVSLWKIQGILGGNVSSFSSVFLQRTDDSSQTSPYHTFTEDIPSHLLDVLPNPATSTPSSRYLILISSEGLVIADIDRCESSQPLHGPFTCCKSLCDASADR